jgi:hypothetical protein
MGQAGEVAKLDHLGDFRFLPGEPLQRFVQGQELVVCGSGGEFDVVQIQLPVAATVL